MVYVSEKEQRVIDKISHPVGEISLTIPLQRAKALLICLHHEYLHYGIVGAETRTLLKDLNEKVLELDPDFKPDPQGP